jgi:phosphoribosyl-AMP cyclohydrolase
LKFNKIAGKQQQQQQQRHQHLYSTPFELDYYDDSSNPYGDNDEQPSSLACPADTKLVLGLNKYSHDTSLCAANAETGEVLFAIAKERLSRKKNDSGNVLTMVETCLESLDLDYDAITKVVMNNHHHRILPLEENRAHMEWESALGINGGAEAGYEEEENVLPDAERVSTTLPTYL